MKKRFTFLIAALMLLMMVLPGKVWADTASFSHTDFTGQGSSGSGGNLTATIGDITITGKGYGNSSYLQVYATNYLIFTPNNGATITQIVLTATNTSYIKTWSASDESTVSVSTNTATWSGSSTSAITLTNTASAQARITGITVTYSVPVSYTITAQSNNESYGTVSLSGYIITGAPKANCRYATPAYTVSPANSATVTQNGNEFTVTPSANTTVTINFEAIPTHNATFSVNGTPTSTSYAEGAAITFPSNPSDINGKTFVGWSTTTISGITQEAPTFVTSATMGTNDVTFYAVFANSETSQGTVEHELTITASTLTNLANSYPNDKSSNTITVEGESYTIEYNACKQSDQIQMRDNSVISFIYFPTLPGNIKRVYTTACNNAGTGTYIGTIHLKTTKTRGDSDTDDITKAQLNSVNDFSINMPANNKYFYFLTSAGLRLSNLTVVYEVSGETTVYSNYCTTVPSLDTWFVTYNGNGADGGEVPVDNTGYNSSNNTVTVLGPGTLSKTGHTWAIWHTDPEGEEGTPYTEGNTFTISANTTLYAQWTINTYNYTLNVTGDDDEAEAELEVDGSAAGATVDYGKEVEVVVVTNTGYNYSISVKDANNNDVPVANNKFTMPASDVTVTVITTEVPTYTLVTSIDQLVAGKHYIIASSKAAGDAYAMGAQSGNIRAAVAVTITDNSGVMSIESVDGIRELVLSGNSGNWTLYDKVNPGFLYASSSSSNNIGTRDANGDEDSQWAIDFYAQEAVIVAQGTNERNTIRYNYNGGSPRFSCYGESTTLENYLYLYVLETDKSFEFYSNTTLGTATVANNETYTIKNSANYSPVLTVTGTLTVNGTLTNSGTAANLVIKNGGQLISNNSVAATMEKSVKAYDEDWNTLSTPVHTEDNAYVTFANVENITYMNALDEPKYNVYYLDETTNKWINNLHNDLGFSQLDKGRGYIYRREEAATLKFKGYTNVGPVNYTLTYTDNAIQGLNLIGNPYTHSIYKGHVGSAIVNGTLLEARFCVFDSEQGTFTLTNDGTEILPMQAILVQALDQSELGNNYTLTIVDSKNYVPVPVNDGKYGNDNIWFTVKNNDFTDVACVDFKEGHGFNKPEHRNENAQMLYIMNNGERFASACMPDNTSVINLGFEAKTMGEYTISLKAEGQYSYMHLIDKLTGEDIDMLVEDSYTFIGSQNDRKDRFVLNLNYNAAGIDSESDIFAYQSGSDIIVSGEGELQVFDITGRKVMTTNINGVQTVNGMNTGVYIFRMNGKAQKIVVR